LMLANIHSSSELLGADTLDAAGPYGGPAGRRLKRVCKALLCLGRLTGKLSHFLILCTFRDVLSVNSLFLQASDY